MPDELPKSQGRTSAVMFSYVGNPSSLKSACKKMHGFKMPEIGHIQFTFTTRIHDSSVAILKSRLIQNAPGVFESEFTYIIDVLRRDEIVFVYGRFELVSAIINVIKKHYADTMKAELPLRTFRINIDKLVKNHRNRVTKIHALLKNTEGMHSATLYGEDVVKSAIFKLHLVRASLVTARLWCPLGCVGGAVEFHEDGSFTTPPEGGLSDEIVESVVKLLARDYHA